MATVDFATSAPRQEEEEAVVAAPTATLTPTAPSSSSPTSLLLPLLLVNAFPLVVFLAWLIYMGSNNSWGVYTDGWPMALTAILGSFVAGCSPLGGGAIAYPVLVLLLNVVSKEARIFAMMQQSIGMTSASWRIMFAAKHRIDYPLLSSIILFGIIGFNLGYYLLEIPGAYVQTIYFTSTVVLGVLVQIFLNWLYLSEVRTRDVVISRGDVPVFILVMILGGILHSYVGTGADVIMYIYFRFAKNVDEVVATNYSVLLSTALSLFGFYNETIIARMAISARIWRFFLCVIPVVSAFAPLGSFVANRVFSRTVLNMFIYFLEIFQYVAGFAITIYKGPILIAISLSMVGASLVFMGVAYMVHTRKWVCIKGGSARQGGEKGGEEEGGGGVRGGVSGPSLAA